MSVDRSQIARYSAPDYERSFRSLPPGGCKTTNPSVHTEECAVCASPMMLVHALGSFAPGKQTIIIITNDRLFGGNGRTHWFLSHYDCCTIEERARWINATLATVAHGLVLCERCNLTFSYSLLLINFLAAKICRPSLSRSRCRCRRRCRRPRGTSAQMSRSSPSLVPISQLIGNVEIRHHGGDQNHLASICSWSVAATHDEMIVVAEELLCFPRRDYTSCSDQLPIVALGVDHYVLCL
jgi:hypothetical protein